MQAAASGSAPAREEGGGGGTEVQGGGGKECLSTKSFSFVLDKNRIRCVSKKPAYNSCVVSKALADGEEVWHKLSSGNSF